MKIRSDFVTNSSSSSFVGIFATTKDNQTHYLLEEEDVWYDLYSAPFFEKGKLYYRRDTDGKKKEIKTIGELMGILAYPAYQDELSNNEFVYVFRYKLGDIDNKELAKEILETGAFEGFVGDYEDEEELANSFDDFMTDILEEFYLPFKNNEEDDADEDYEDDETEIVNSFIDFAKEYNLEDISSLTIDLSDFERDEGMNQFIERLCDLIDDSEIEFHQMSRDDEDFDKTVEALVETIEKRVFDGKAYDIFEDLEELVADGLEAGEAWQMLPSCLTLEDGVTLDFEARKAK